MGLSLSPQSINETNWYYEERKGISLIHEVYNLANEYRQTDHIIIPWSMIEKSLARKKHKKRP